jgi:hypothetical protein
LRKILLRVNGNLTIALLLSFLSLILCVILVEIILSDGIKIGCCLESSPVNRAIDAARSEFNGRENLRWANIKMSGRQFQTDAEIDREIVYGKIHGGWNTDLGADYTWTVAPTAAGGTISFQSSTGVALTRKAATLDSPATWY